MGRTVWRLAPSLGPRALRGDGPRRSLCWTSPSPAAFFWSKRHELGGADVGADEYGCGACVVLALERGLEDRLLVRAWRWWCEPGALEDRADARIAIDRALGHEPRGHGVLACDGGMEVIDHLVAICAA